MLRPAYAAKDAAFHYETLKVLATASELLYSWDLQDIIDSAGDADSIGKSVAKFASDKTAPQQLLVAMALMRKLNEQIPSDIGKAWEQMSKQLEALSPPKK